MAGSAASVVFTTRFVGTVWEADLLACAILVAELGFSTTVVPAGCGTRTPVGVAEFVFVTTGRLACCELALTGVLVATRCRATALTTVECSAASIVGIAAVRPQILAGRRRTTRIVTVAHFSVAAAGIPTARESALALKTLVACPVDSATAAVQRVSAGIAGLATLCSHLLAGLRATAGIAVAGLSRCAAGSLT